MQTNKRRNSNPKLMGLIFTLVGAAIFWFFSLPPLKYSLESKSWPVTSGTITRSEVDSWTKDSKSQYDARISYNYVVEGKKYTSSKLNTSGSYSGGNISKAKELVNEFPVGKTVDVYYDPELPDSASLKPGVSNTDIVMAVFPLIFFFIGLTVLFGIIKPKPSSTNYNTHGKTDISKVIRNIMNK